MICQCGSGASGALKSSDNVSVRAAPLPVSVTLPVLALTPAKGVLVLVCAIALAATASVATANIAARNAREYIVLIASSSMLVAVGAQCGAFWGLRCRASAKVS